MSMRTSLLVLVCGCTEYGLKHGDGNDRPPDTPTGTGGTTPAETTPVVPPVTTTDPDHTLDPPTTDTTTHDPGTGTDVPPEIDLHDDPNDPGLDGGHFDVDTSSFVSDIGNGNTDAHVHEYDDQYDVVGVNLMAFLAASLHDLDEDVTDPAQRFKLIVANGDLSPGARFTVDDVYVATDPRTWTEVDDYDDTDVSALPVWSLGGVAGSTRLGNLGLYFDPDAILDGDLVPSVTGCVQANELSLDGGWRNGAITIQAVAVDADGTDAFTTDLSLSIGGVQGVATSGLLWETTLFWHWDGPCASDPDWLTWVPTP